MAETGTPGTFIPHDTAVAPVRPRNTSGLNDLVLLCGIVLLVASAALAIGVFLYAQFLQQQTASKTKQIQVAETELQPALIENITRLSDRMQAAGTILDSHLAPTAFFNALNQATLQTVSFTTLKLDSPDAQHITLTMQGVAQSVNSIALQAQLFSQNGVITDPIFSNIARESDGVHFDLSAVINPAALDYTTFLRNGGVTAATSTAVQVVPQTPPSSSAQTATTTSASNAGNTSTLSTGADTTPSPFTPVDGSGTGATQ